MGIHYRLYEELRYYQEWLAEQIILLRFVLLAVPMGLGKTAAVLLAISNLLQAGKVRKILIVAPLRVAENTWPDEIMDWAFSRGLEFAVLTGEPHQRAGACRSKAPIHIINRENLPWLWKHWKAHGGWPYDMLVYDESSRLKEGKKKTGSSRISEFGAMSNARHFFKYVVEMTGTPAPNGLQDLWGQFYIIDGGVRLGSDRTAFQRRWFNADIFGRLTPFPHSHDEIMARVKDSMLALREKDYLELPPVIPNTIKVQLPADLMKEYKTFKRTLVSERFDVEAVSSGVLTSKLLQFANGAMYRWKDPDNPKAGRDEVEIHHKKLDALDSIITEAQGNPILVAYSFRFDLERIKKRFKKTVIFEDEKDAVRLWNAGKIPILLAHPASMGHGLNMQYGGHIAVWYGMTWSLELYQQFNKRLPRPGQKSEHVFLHHIVAEGTADEDTLVAMNTKGATQDTITDAVAVHLKKAA